MSVALWGPMKCVSTLSPSAVLAIVLPTVSLERSKKPGLRIVDCWASRSSCTTGRSENRGNGAGSKAGAGVLRDRAQQCTADQSNATHVRDRESA